MTARFMCASRDPWPLYAYPDEDTELDVFTDAGSFSDEFRAFLVGK